MEKFRALLNEHHDWPCDYTFKFVVPAGKQQAVEALVDGAAVSIRPSKKGTYVSVTLTVRVTSADAVIAVHQEAAKIEGLIAL